MLAWHFTKSRTLRDGSLLKEGRTYTTKKTPVLCRTGFHASRRIFDARQYMRGDFLSLVWCEGKTQEVKDKFVCRRRTVLAVIWVATLFTGLDSDVSGMREELNKKYSAGELSYLEFQHEHERLDALWESKARALVLRFIPALAV